MKEETKIRVWHILYDHAISQLPKFTKWNIADLKLAYPFHRLFFSDEALMSARVERSVVTAMGDKLYPALAEALSKDRYSDVVLERTIEGMVNDAAANMVEQIATELRTPKKQRATPREPDHNRELAAILNSPGGGQISRTVTADLYVGDFSEGPLFIELKTPMPNLDIAAESKKKILYYHLIMDRKGISNAKAFLGLTYNPYLTRKKYAHSFTKQIMDMERQVLIGSEMWDLIGGLGAFDELLEIIDDVHQHIPKQT